MVGDVHPETLRLVVAHAGALAQLVQLAAAWTRGPAERAL